jgi:ribosomal 50S subunit-recycling heat shock protein
MQQARKEAKKAVEQEEIAAARGVEHKKRHAKAVRREGRLMRRLAHKSLKVRVHKPKPKRRPKKMVTTVSVGGVPVEDNEDEYTYFQKQ